MINDEINSYFSNYNKYIYFITKNIASSGQEVMVDHSILLITSAKPSQSILLVMIKTTCTEHCSTGKYMYMTDMYKAVCANTYPFSHQKVNFEKMLAFSSGHGPCIRKIKK